MEATAVPAEAPAVRLIRKRDAAALAFVVGLLALLCCGAILGPWPQWKLSFLLNPGSLPGALAGVAVGMALVFAPTWAAPLRRTDGRLDATAGARALFAGCWQAAALGYFLLLASRMGTLDSLPILRSMALLAGWGTLAVLAAARFPRAYAGLAFFVAIALPFFCLVLADVQGMTPAGSRGWTHAEGLPAQRLRLLVDGLLLASPGTSVLGALKGRLVSVSEVAGKETVLVLMGIALASGGLLASARPAQSPKSLNEKNIQG
ncbi:MAG: hypothetical protein KIS92_12260 [Planctomycetota bacterium]|nr:hypothetical protein [Planctomycetota bacterium]